MADLKRTGSAVWTGTLREGKGRTSLGSGLLADAPVTFVSRFEHGDGTNPEELIGAAHASCFSMAFSASLTKAGFPPGEIRTTATVTLRSGDAGWSVVGVHLDTAGRVPDIDEPRFLEIAEQAKQGCPISRLLAPGLESLTVEAKLEA